MHDQNLRGLTAQHGAHGRPRVGADLGRVHPHRLRARALPARGAALDQGVDPTAPGLERQHGSGGRPHPHRLPLRPTVMGGVDTAPGGPAVAAVRETQDRDVAGCQGLEAAHRGLGGRDARPAPASVGGPHDRPARRLGARGASQHPAVRRADERRRVRREPRRYGATGRTQGCRGGGARAGPAGDRARRRAGRGRAHGRAGTGRRWRACAGLGFLHGRAGRACRQAEREEPRDHRGADHPKTIGPKTISWPTIRSKTLPVHAEPPESPC